MDMKTFSYIKYIFLIGLIIPIGCFFKENIFSNRNVVLISGFSDIEEKDAHSSLEESNDSDFPTNPSELMNILKRLEAMNNATEPSDAIDDALKAFEREGKNQSFPDAGFSVNN